MIHFLNYCGILQIMVKCALFSVVNTDPDLEIFSGSRAGIICFGSISRQKGKKQLNNQNFIYFLL